MYIAAHKHFYERLHPLRNDRPCRTSEKCPLEVVHGSAGNNEDVDKGGSAHKEWVAASDYEHRGFLELEIFNASAAQLRFIRSSDHSTVDEVTVMK
mmetsp:Transcript_34589/g.80895  ORF Transcript_34589/g.80895 Transcript_34589/m.80895 type:complete len:96 (+) Transcript_34589:450-737(+)